MEKVNANICIPILISGARDDSTEEVYTIINDELICYQPYWKFYLNPFSAYNSLILVSKNAEMNIIPSELHKYFDRKKSLVENKIWQEKKELYCKDTNTFCLMEVSSGNGIVFEDQLLYHTIEMKKKVIELKFIFKIRNEDTDTQQVSKLLIEEIVEMTPQQAFIFFANICVAYFEFTSFFPKDKDSQFKAFNPSMGSDLRTVYRFAKRYLLWLEKKLVNSEIEPQTILQFSGYRALCQLLDRKAVQELSSVQDLLQNTLKIVENFRETPKLKLILYYTFYRKAVRKDYFKVVRRWAKTAIGMRSAEFYSVEVEQYLEEMLTQMRNNYRESKKKQMK